MEVLIFGILGLAVTQLVISYPLWYGLRALMRQMGSGESRRAVDLTFVALMAVLAVIWGAAHPSLFGNGHSQGASATLPFAYFVGSAVIFFVKMLMPSGAAANP